MQIAGMGQLGVTIKESFGTLIKDNHLDADKEASSIRNRYIDSVEFSDRAIELSRGVDIETSPKRKSEMDMRQEGNPGTKRQEPAFAGALSLNVLA